jgi:hypothetical protein
MTGDRLVLEPQPCGAADHPITTTHSPSAWSYQNPAGLA